ncbi:tetratricopeptide repeat protein [Skeletonema marinoi]|uniref:Tetratricopeptide repeat protein n=1 Tax=Skeletonema marinoi TaxID=267567 RepID=A0AAD8XT37_9STRA|nr:tetratricopeptide repeat protein [Skeletonema marinoi]
MTMATSTAAKKGVAGRIDYDSWEKRASNLSKELDEEDEQEKEAAASALGLDGKHARSQAEAEEKSKAEEMQKAKQRLEAYEKREQGVTETLSGLLGPVVDDDTTAEVEEKHQEIKYITRESIGAGKRVLTVADTKGRGKIVLTQDLSNLESRTATNTSLKPKSYDDDAENKEEMPEATVHRGIIKLNLRNLHQCTVIVKCKIITGTIEISHCEDVTLIVEGDDATAATIQADLCTNLDIQFHDAPSGKNIPLRVRDTNSGPTTTLYWGQDVNDRIYHAGVSNLRVRTYRDGFVDLDTTSDYKKNGAKAVGNAAAEEVQFVTSVIEDELITERVLKPGDSKEIKQGARPMTERELRELEKKKSQIEEALDEKLKDLIQIKDKNGGVAVVQQAEKKAVEKEEVIEEVYASATKEEIEAIVSSIEDQKAKGNEAFTSGEYAQAILLYTMALDEAARLPDVSSVTEKLSSSVISEPLEQLFPRHVILSNRSACFLKLGHHEKALKDGSDAEILNPAYVKGVFRKGLALHAMGRYREAIDALAKAQKVEPKNKQIKQALQFAEVRLHQEMRKRMET